MKTKMFSRLLGLALAAAMALSLTACGGTGGTSTGGTSTGGTSTGGASSGVTSPAGSWVEMV